VVTPVTGLGLALAGLATVRLFVPLEEKTTSTQ
jgi:hypothetical protein